MAKLVLVVYHHNHGVDVLPIALEDSTNDAVALEIARANMVDEFGEDDVVRDEDQYGGFDLANTIADGTEYHTDTNKTVILRLNEGSA